MADSRRPKKNTFVNGLKTEWSLFWHSIVENDDAEAEKEERFNDSSFDEKIETLSLEQLKALTKALSTDRKKLNQKMEAIGKELDLNTAKLESLKLVGGDTEDTLKRINELGDMGQKLSESLDRINSRLKTARLREDSLKKASREI